MLKALVGSFWTSGKFDSASDDFKWDGNGNKVTDGKDWSDSPWKKEPQNSRKENSRVVLEYTSTSEISLSFADETEPKRYICEDKLLIYGLCIRLADYMDVVFVLDASFDMFHFTSYSGKLMRRMVMKSEPSESFRFAFFWYGSEIQESAWSFHLNNNMTREEMDEKIKHDAREADSSGNHHKLAIEIATKEILDNPRPGVVSRNIVIFTNGEHEEDDWNPIDAATKAIMSGINILVMQIIDDEYTEDRSDTKDYIINMVGGSRYSDRILLYKKDDSKIVEEKMWDNAIEKICRT